MKRPALAILALLVTAAALSAATGTRMLLVARDLEERPLPGFFFTYAGNESFATTRAGATELSLPADHLPGRQIKICLLPTSEQAKKEWFLVDPQVNIPTASEPVEVVLMRRSTFRQFAAEARDTPDQTAMGSIESTAEARKRTLIEAAAHYGLTEEQVEKALHSFAETQDPKDQGIAAYFESNFSQAEELLKKAAEKKESDYVETLRYLGASQLEQAKYRAATETFRKALALRGEDAVLLSWLGRSFYELAEWTEAEKLLRRALTIDEQRFGPEHPRVASGLNNLASLVQATNRPSEAEQLMLKALAIDEKSFGLVHPRVAIRLNNLASLLYDTNRLDEAEPLMRRALDIYKMSFGAEHSAVAIALNNLAQLLQATNRPCEAEPLMLQVLAIDEKSFGAEHPAVAIALNNLARLLQTTNRLGEAEPLMRRALVILLEHGHRSGHEHPYQSVVSGNYRWLLQEMGKSGAEIEAAVETLVQSSSK